MPCRASESSRFVEPISWLLGKRGLDQNLCHAGAVSSKNNNYWGSYGGSLWRSHHPTAADVQIFDNEKSNKRTEAEFRSKEEITIIANSDKKLYKSVETTADKDDIKTYRRTSDELY